MASKALEEAVERATGESVDALRSTPLDERRALLEAQRGERVKYVSWSPVIGRGNVLSDRIVSHEQAEQAYEDAIRK